jgi:protein required for attachment to host cells
MKKIHYLIANSQQARYFEQHLPSHTLTEITDFVHPLSTLTQRTHQAHTNSVAEEVGKGHGRTAHAGTQFEPHTEWQDKERHLFAQQLAQFVNTEVYQQRCRELILVASAPLLGALTPLLSSGTHKVLRQKIAKDYAHLRGRDLEHHIEACCAEA